MLINMKQNLNSDVAISHGHIAKADAFTWFYTFNKTSVFIGPETVLQFTNRLNSLHI